MGATPVVPGSQMTHAMPLAGFRQRHHSLGYVKEGPLPARAAGATWDVAIISTLLGHLARQREQYAQARACYRESLPLFRAFSSPTYLAWCLEGMAAALCAEGYVVRATRLCAAAAALREEAHTPLPPAEREPFNLTVATARSMLGEQRFHGEWAAGSACPLDEVVAEALLDEALTRSDLPR